MHFSFEIWYLVEIIFTISWQSTDQISYTCWLIPDFYPSPLNFYEASRFVHIQPRLFVLLCIRGSLTLMQWRIYRGPSRLRPPPFWATDWPRHSRSPARAIGMDYDNETLTIITDRGAKKILKKFADGLPDSLNICCYVESNGCRSFVHSSCFGLKKTFFKNLQYR